VGGFFAYDRIQNQLDAAKPVVVPDVRGIKELNAVQQVRAKGLEPDVHRQPDAETPLGIVFEQDPGPGNKVDRGNIVTIRVSTGKPKTRVPNVVGRSQAEALQALSDAHLRWNVVSVFSEKESGVVTAQAPKGGQRLVEGSFVRINVSRGSRPVQVPSVIGQPYASAESALRGIGLVVARQEIDSNDPAGNVVSQSPAPGNTAAKGSTVTLQVSKGPQSTALPDVTNQDADSARAALEELKFKVKVVRQDTTDPLEDNVVISQSPDAGTEADPGSTVTLTVGRFVEGPPPPTTPTDTKTTP
jgi:serine/threonine-protein kinase